MRYPHIHNRTRKPSSIKGHTSNRDLDGVYDDDGEVFKDNNFQDDNDKGDKNDKYNLL